MTRLTGHSIILHLYTRNISGHLMTFFFGNLRSVPVLRRLYDEQSDFRVKRPQRYSGDSWFRDLKTIVLDSHVISSSMIFHPISSMRGPPGASKLLFVIILAAYKSNLSTGYRETHKSSNFTLITQWRCPIAVI